MATLVDFVDFDGNFFTFRLVIVVLAMVASAIAENRTTPSPMVECTTQNCIFSYTKMDDAKFNEMISPDAGSGILALKFSSCELVELPKSSFIKFPSLLCFMATSPGLSAIENDSFLSASNLQFLYLPGNQIKRLSPKSFAGASNLNEINLSDNLIEIVAEDAFEGLEHLESLSLSRNQIAFFGQETFAPLADLMNLDISGNTIEFLDSRLFSNNDKLNGINIADNQIVSITNGFMKLLPQIKVLNIMNNPCTNNTMLENIPLIKIIDSKDMNSDDESSLAGCYANYLEMADPESTDLNDLLAQAEIVREDIESNIIADLNEELREKDIFIRDLERRDDLLKVCILFMFVAAFFLLIIRIIVKVVNSAYHNEIQKKIKDNVEVVTVDPKQVVYTIEI